jgi:hypothetical protein
VRRFRCANPACDRQTFAESLSLAMPYQRRSQRLQKVHAQVGLALGGVSTQHYMMLKRNFIYTGTTRGKRLVILVGQKRALGMAVKGKQAQRRSKLAEWLRS